ncbi:hypothetical protein A2872_04575 [Candidatus Gottesmanbacteria bacterium RIFCSPHIGHO2_01_FULL_42_12]|uniref:ChbG/HpnK family deacetylase n=1 Tax=Candidatus Gottesmanbacteria bacterium RIFCSPHIGHO2_01_FULL_42_12 TaxID=1798377 RepID=A0A1F5YZY7_9BACT|nr:MAG: hypothetical protein A2872_04575 [Candidatus Gottesmanbacteria bacterium RIFCSPHIGHO2_01_FULL_42_12]
MKRLIFNADDFGISQKTDDGILYLAKIGIVTSASLMITSGRAVKAFEQAKKLNLSIGLHLDATSLNNRFSRKIKYAFENKTTLNNADFKKLFNKFNIQLNFFEKTFNKKPDHINFHHPLYWIPSFTDRYRKFVEKTELPCRWFSDLVNVGVPHPAYTEFGFYDKGTLTLDSLIKLIDNVPNGTTEFMLHPGYHDKDLNMLYIMEREEQLKILADKNFQKYLNKHNIKLINFCQL